MPIQKMKFPDSQPSETNVSKRLAALVFCVTIALTLGINACDNLVTEQITEVVAGNPTAKFRADVDSGCAPMTVQFTDISDGPRDQWQWRFGDGDSSSDTNPTHTYAAPGTYDIFLKITDNSLDPVGSDFSSIKRFIVIGSSIAGFSMDTALGCVGLAVTFTPSSLGTNSFGISSYSWRFGDGETSTDSVPTHTFNTIGDFPIEQIVNGDCGVDTAFDTVRIGACPTFTFDADLTDICIGDTIIFTETTTDVPTHPSLTWDFGDGTVTNVINTNVITHIYADTGLYTVTLTAFDTAGVSFTDSLVDYIRVNDLLSADFEVLGPTFACKTATGQFVVGFSDISTGSVTNRIWDFGDGTFDSTNDPTPFHAYTTPGKYDVELEAFGGCNFLGADVVVKTNIISLADTVTPLFVIIQAGRDTTAIFEGTSLGLPTSWVWNYGDGSPPESTQVVTHFYANDFDSFLVTLTVTNSCTSGSKTFSDSVFIDSVVTLP